MPGHMNMGEPSHQCQQRQICKWKHESKELSIRICLRSHGVAPPVATLILRRTLSVCFPTVFEKLLVHFLVCMQTPEDGVLAFLSLIYTYMCTCSEKGDHLRSTIMVKVAHVISMQMCHQSSAQCNKIDIRSHLPAFDMHHRQFAGP